MLDLVVYGASGFTGRLVARYLAISAPEGLKWALGGRNEAKLAEVRAELCTLNPSLKELPLVVGEGSTIDVIAKSARAVISTAGPFSLYGEPLLAACVERGTHYADITGETAWVERMAARYESRAKETGSLVIPMCGLDSIPSDLGAFFAVETARKVCGWGVPVRSVTTYVAMKGSVSGGTIASGKAIASDPELASRSRDPFLLVPQGRGLPSAHQLVSPEPDTLWPTWVPALRAYASPGVLAALNTRVVRRSAGLFATHKGLAGAAAAKGGPGVLCLPTAQETGPKATGGGGGTASTSPYAYSSAATPFAYSEFSVHRSWWSAFTTKLGGVLIGALLFKPYFFPLVAGSLPKPGEGPSDEAISKGWFHYFILAETEETPTRTVAVKVSGGDPG